MKEKVNAHIAKAMAFAPALHKSVRENEKDVTRRLSHEGKPCAYKPGQVVACVTHWRTTIILDKLKPTDLAGFPERLVPIQWEAQSGILSHPGKFRQARFFPRDSYDHDAVPLRKIVSVRQERLQEITEEDAVREGVEKLPSPIGYAVDRWKDYEGKHTAFAFPRASFASLINFIQGPGTWESNPLVWRIEFTPIEIAP